MPTTRGRDATFSGRRMNEILDAVRPKLRRAFLEMIERVRGQLGPDAVETMIRERRYGDADATYEEAARLFAREATNLFVDSGKEFHDFVSGALDVVVGFDQFSERAVRYVHESELSTIREFTQEQRDVVRAVVADGIARGINPREQAREIRESIGLTSRQLQAVQNYRRALEGGTAEALSRELRDRRFDSTVRRAAREGEPLTRDQVDRMVARYSERFLKFRAETIARDQSLQALHAGLDEATNQIVGGGLFSADEVTRTWEDSGNDGRTRDAHLNMRVRVVGPNESFVDGDWNELRFPGDPLAPPETRIQCRCVVSTRVSLRRATAQEGSLATAQPAAAEA